MRKEDPRGYKFDEKYGGNIFRKRTMLKKKAKKVIAISITGVSMLYAGVEIANYRHYTPQNEPFNRPIEKNEVNYNMNYNNNDISGAEYNENAGTITASSKTSFDEFVEDKSFPWYIEKLNHDVKDKMLGVVRSNPLWKQDTKSISEFFYNAEVVFNEGEPWMKDEYSRMFREMMDIALKDTLYRSMQKVGNPLKVKSPDDIQFKESAMYGMEIIDQDTSMIIASHRNRGALPKNVENVMYWIAGKSKIHSLNDFNVALADFASISGNNNIKYSYSQSGFTSEYEDIRIRKNNPALKLDKIETVKSCLKELFNNFEQDIDN